MSAKPEHLFWMTWSCDMLEELLKSSRFPLEPVFRGISRANRLRSLGKVTLGKSLGFGKVTFPFPGGNIK